LGDLRETLTGAKPTADRSPYRCTRLLPSELQVSTLIIIRDKLLSVASHVHLDGILGAGDITDEREQLDGGLLKVNVALHFAAFKCSSDPIDGKLN
jgi:hypothetical protein